MTTASISNSLKILTSEGCIPYQPFLTNSLGKLVGYSLPSLEYVYKWSWFFYTLCLKAQSCSIKLWWMKKWMNGANTGSDWAFCKNEQEGPGSHYYEASNTTGLVFFFFSCKNKYLSWRITLIFPLSPTAHSSRILADNRSSRVLALPSWAQNNLLPLFERMPEILSTGGQSLSSANYW